MDILSMILLAPFVILGAFMWFFVATLAIDLITLRRFELYERIWRA